VGDRGENQSGPGPGSAANGFGYSRGEKQRRGRSLAPGWEDRGRWGCPGGRCGGSCPNSPRHPQRRSEVPIFLSWAPFPCWGLRRVALDVLHWAPASRGFALTFPWLHATPAARRPISQSSFSLMCSLVWASRGPGVVRAFRGRGAVRQAPQSGMLDAGIGTPRCAGSGRLGAALGRISGPNLWGPRKLFAGGWRGSMESMSCGHRATAAGVRRPIASHRRAFFGQKPGRCGAGRGRRTVTGAEEAGCSSWRHWLRPARKNHGDFGRQLRGGRPDKRGFAHAGCGCRCPGGVRGAQNLVARSR